MHNIPEFKFPFVQRIYTAMMEHLPQYTPCSEDATNIYRCLPLLGEVYSDLLVYRHFGRYTNQQLMQAFGHTETETLQLEKEALNKLAFMLTDMRNNPQNYPANSGSYLELLANK